jgi:hypothetical protein
VGDALRKKLLNIISESKRRPFLANTSETLHVDSSIGKEEEELMAKGEETIHNCQSTIDNC